MKAFLLFVSFLVSGTFGDRLYLRNGEELLGQLVKILNDTVYFKTPDTLFVYPMDSISSLDFQRRRPGDEWKTVSDINDTVLLRELDEDVSKYTGAGYVNLFRLRRIRVNEDSSVVYTERRIVRILSERGKSYANRSILFFPDCEELSIDFARAVLPDSHVVSIKDNAIEDVSFISKPAFYDRAKRRKMAIPGAEVGSILDYQFTIKRKKIDFSRPFFFDLLLGDREPFLDDCIEVVVPNGFALAHYEERISLPDSSIGKDSCIYIWRLKNHKGVKREPSMPPYPYILPRVVIGTKDDFEKLSKLYSSVVKDSLEVPSDIIEGLPFATSKSIAEIYRWVAQNVETVPLSMEQYKLFPHSVKTIVSNRFGTPLDKAFLLYALLRNRGINCDLVLVHNKGKGKFTEKVPSLAQFQSAIVSIGDTLFLDPSLRDGDMGYVRPEYQGIAGLKVGSGITWVPFVPNSANCREIRLVVELGESGSAVCKMKEIMKGRYGLPFRALRALSEAERTKRIEEILTRIYPGAELIDYELSGLEHLNVPVVLDLRFKLPDFYEEAGDYILFRLPGLKYDASSVAAEERSYPLYFDEGYRSRQRIEFVLPEGFRVKSYPEGFELNSEMLSYKADFSLKGDTLIFEDETQERGGIFQSSLYGDYRRIIQRRAEVPKGWVVLQREE